MERNKLLFITQKVDLDDDVLGVYHRWIEELSKRTDSVSVICLFRGRTELPDNVRVYSLGKESGVGRLGYVFNFFKYIWTLRNAYDSVFIHMNPEYVILAGWLWRILGKKVVFWYAHYLSNWRLVVASWLADTIVTSTRLAYPRSSNKLIVLQQGIDTEKFLPEENKTSGDILKVLFLGRIAPVKDLETLLKAVELANLKGVKLSLTIVGGPTAGKPVEQAYYLKIQSLAEKLPAGLVILKDPVPNWQTPLLYNQHDLFINLTVTGSFDKTTLEAMSCGMPVLVANRAFLDIFPAEIVDDLMFRDGDANDLADKIIKLSTSSSESRVAIGKRMRELIIDRHDLRKLADRIINVLNR